MLHLDYIAVPSAMWPDTTNQAPLVCTVSSPLDVFGMTAEWSESMAHAWLLKVRVADYSISRSIDAKGVD